MNMSETTNVLESKNSQVNNVLHSL